MCWSVHSYETYRCLFNGMWIDFKIFKAKTIGMHNIINIKLDMNKSFTRSTSSAEIMGNADVFSCTPAIVLAIDLGIAKELSGRRVTSSQYSMRALYMYSRGLSINH